MKRTYYQRFMAWLMLTVAVLAHPATADTEEIMSLVVSAQIKLDRAFATPDWATVDSLMTEDHAAVAPYLDGITDLQKAKADIVEADFTTRDIGVPAATLLSETVVMVTQEKLYDGTFNNHPLPPRVLFSAIWVNVDGKWLQRYYQETTLPEVNSN